MSEDRLRAPAGANRERKIVGRGRSGAAGKTSGRGHKGQKSRSGGGTRIGFEGGQMPLYRRVARRGFSNSPFKTGFVVINLFSLEKLYSDGETVSLETLIEKGLIKKSEDAVKILGGGDLTKKLTVNLPGISASARAKILKVGGVVNVPGEQSETGKQDNNGK